MNADGTDFRRLTDDRYGDLQPQWSPDGKTIAFASDRDSASFDLLRFKPWRIALLDLATGAIDGVPGPGGAEPQSAVGARRPIDRVRLRPHRDGERLPLRPRRARALSAHERRRRGLGAHGVQPGDQLGARRRSARVHVLRERRSTRSGRSTIRARCERSPYRDPPRAASIADDADSRPTAVRRATGLDRRAARLVRPRAARHDEVPRRRRIASRFQPDYVGAAEHRPTRPMRSAAACSAARRVVMSDMLGNNHLAISGEINGRLSEARAFLGYTNLAHRWQYSTALSQAPYYFLSSDSLVEHDRSGRRARESGDHDVRRAAGVRASRRIRSIASRGSSSARASTTSIAAAGSCTRKIFDGSAAGAYSVDSTHRDPTLNYVDGQIALVSDNTLFGYTGPIMGRRFRFQVSPVVGVVRLDRVSRRLSPLRSDHLQLSDARDAPLHRSVDRPGRRRRSRSTSRGRTSCAATIGTARSI